MSRTYLRLRILELVVFPLFFGVMLDGGLTAQPVTLTDVDRVGSQTSLAWQGGNPPFQVQRSANLVDWQDVGSPLDSSEVTLVGEASWQFFRVISSSSEPVLGEYMGQLRVAQGEFGTPLDRHRLKSTWDFYAPPGTPTERTAAAFFESAIVKLEILESGVRTHYTGRLSELPNAAVTTSDRSIRVSWSTGLETAKRDYTLNLAFRYNLGQRRPAIHLSDPTYTFSCRYSEPQLEIDRSGETGTTREDEVELVEIADNSNAPAWWRRKLEVSKGEVTVDSRFEIGVPNIEGGPAFIFKTPLLTDWERTRISGLTEEPIELTSRFSQTYFPFHHNFVETLYLEPSLEPGISDAILAELREHNIRWIVPTQPTAFPEAESTLQVIGFDGEIRELP